MVALPIVWLSDVFIIIIQTASACLPNHELWCNASVIWTISSTISGVHLMFRDAKKKLEIGPHLELRNMCFPSRLGIQDSIFQPIAFSSRIFVNIRPIAFEPGVRQSAYNNIYAWENLDNYCVVEIRAWILEVACCEFSSKFTPSHLTVWTVCSKSEATPSIYWSLGKSPLFFFWHFGLSDFVSVIIKEQKGSRKRDYLEKWPSPLNKFPRNWNSCMTWSHESIMMPFMFQTIAVHSCSSGQM